ncbi:MAG: IS1634 family transposase [Hormoscilla sp. GUM202]|nr:IS1634 family transposase [Hormoscilla sp. GUM202]
MSAPLYLFARFFEGKAIEHLIGVGVKPEYLNDDKLGRVMDELYEIGIGEVEIALSVLKKYQIKRETAHRDSSSFHVHGEYKTSSVVEPRPIKITHGYSRDHRPDLKQYTMQLICSGDGGIPLWIKMGDGNASDQKEIPLAITEFKKSFEFSGLMVADAALYTQDNWQILGDIKWLSRVPLTIKAAKKLVTEAKTENFISCEQAGYRYLEVTQNYGDIEQRWLVIESQERRESDLKKFSDKIDKDLRVVQKKLKALSDRELACAPDAIVAAKKLLKKSLYHELTDIKTQSISTKSENGESYCHYQVQATISQCIQQVQDKKNRDDLF